MDQELITLAALTPWIAKPLQLGAVVIGVGFLIFVHELGHFLMAKLQGVRVERFAIGLGRKLWGFTRGETEYALCAIPFGGYVKMAGEYPDQEREGADYEFYSKPPGRRALIILAGVVMNAIVGILIFICAFGLGVYLNSPEIEPAPGGPAWVAGLTDGDEIVEVNGTKINSFTDLAHEVMMSEGEISLKVRRGEEFLVMPVTPDEDTEFGIRTIGVGTRATMTIDQVLMREDLLLRIDDLTGWNNFCLSLPAAANADPSPARRLWELLSPDAKAAVRAVRENPEGIDMARIIQGINCVVVRRDFYDKESFTGIALPDDVKALVKHVSGDLDPGDVFKLNRRLVELAFPDSVQAVSEPAKKHKILAGDVVVAVGEETLVSWNHFRRMVRNNPGRPIHLKVRRKIGGNDSIVSVVVVPAPMGGWSAGCASGNDLYINAVRKGTPAWKAGIERGSSIVSLNGASTGGGKRFSVLVGASGGTAVELGIRRDGVVTTMNVVSEYDLVEDRALIGVIFKLEPIVGNVSADSPAERAGLRAGDRIVSITPHGFEEAIEIRGWTQFEAVINISEGRSMLLVWKRDGEEMTGTLTAARDTSSAYGQLGLGPEMKLKLTQLGLRDAVVYGIKDSYAMGKRVVSTIYGLLRFKVSSKVMAGPVLLPFVGTRFVERGLGTFLYFLGMIGINFAVVNLLPLPVVDGGVLLLTGLEKVRGKPLTLKSQTVVQQIGVAVLIAIFLFITIQDIGRLPALFSNWLQ